MKQQKKKRTGGDNELGYGCDTSGIAKVIHIHLGGVSGGARKTVVIMIGTWKRECRYNPKKE